MYFLTTCGECLFRPECEVEAEIARVGAAMVEPEAIDLSLDEMTALGAACLMVNGL